MIKVSTDCYTQKFGPGLTPVAEVEPGEEILFESMDCFFNKFQKATDTFTEEDWVYCNPATGPVAVKGAEPGDTLVVDILEIKTADKGMMLAYPGDPALCPRVENFEIIEVPVTGDKVELLGYSIPVNKMIGVIGTAPANESVASDTPGRHGGNMDNRYVKEGARVYLPVFVPGAHLALGDLHASMADGEVFTGVEVSGEVRAKVDLIKGKTINWPQIEVDGLFMVVCSDHDLDVAVETCVNEMTDILMERLGVTLNEAGFLLSAVGHTEICQVVDPHKTARMTVPMYLFEKK